MAANFDKYVLRQAAGYYWLLDTEQSGAMYHPPMPMNEVGADIWRMLAKGFSVESIVAQLSEEYEVEQAVAFSDVKDFLEQLKQQKIEFGDEM